MASVRRLSLDLHFSEDEEFLELKAMPFTDEETVSCQASGFFLPGKLKSQHRQSESEELWALGSKGKCCDLA